MEDEKIVELFWARDEDAIKETELKYNDLCHYIAKNFLALREDREECVNDALLALWNSIPPERPKSLRAYLSSIVRNIAISRTRASNAWKRGGVFVLLSMAMGGIALSLGSGSFLSLTLAALSVWLLCKAAFGDRVGGQEYVPVEIIGREGPVCLTALKDTGNTLRDPITGEPVLVIDGATAGKLTGLTQAQLASPLETLAARQVPGLRLIPYRAVGCSSGFLLGIRFDRVKIASRVQGAVVAFAPGRLSGENVYQALIGGVL